MGAGASLLSPETNLNEKIAKGDEETVKGIVTATEQASVDDLSLAFEGLSPEDRARLTAALAAAQGGSTKESVNSTEKTEQAPATATAEATATGDGGAGGAEITGDDELAFELNKQEELFRKCMRNRTEREAKKKLEKQQKKELDQKKRNQALEDAFENEVDKLLDFFSEGFSIETADAYNTTLLSEAGAGGAEDVIQILLGNGADPNRRGRNMRTPLWRAANAGQAGAVQLLLRAGGDPRTPDDAGSKPYHVANGVEVKMMLECWDVSVTETIKQAFGANQKKMEKERKEKEKKQKQEMKEAQESAERKVQIAKTEVARVQKMVVTYRQQRVSMAETGQVEKVEELAPLLERAENELDIAKAILQDLEWQVKRAKMKVRDFENKLRRKNRKDGEEPSGLEQVIWLKDLSDVVVKDVGGKIKEDGRWPLVFDPSGKSVTFFEYSGAACYEADQLTLLANADEKFPEGKEEKRRLRVSLLKHLKHGGTLAISLGDDISKMDAVAEAFNEIEKGLFNTLTDRSVVYSYFLPRRFLHLVPLDLQNDYCEYMFMDDELSKFTLVFIVKAEEPLPEELEKDWNQYYSIKVKDPDAPEPEEDEPEDGEK